jgi:hypothetical protein
MASASSIWWLSMSESLATTIVRFSILRASDVLRRDFHAVYYWWMCARKRNRTNISSGKHKSSEWHMAEWQKMTSCLRDSMMQPAPACEIISSASCMSGASEGLKAYTSTAIPANTRARWNVSMCMLLT